MSVAIPARTASAERAPLVSWMLTWATARRVLAQLRHDPRTIAMMLAVPTVLMILLRYVLNNPLALNRFAPVYIGVFPFVIMFIVTAITTQRERARGTLERLMAMPLGKLDLLAGYAIAFGLELRAGERAGKQAEGHAEDRVEHGDDRYRHRGAGQRDAKPGERDDQHHRHLHARDQAERDRVPR